MGRIVRIVVHNFKSYAGAHTVGPFKPYTSVVGPNGAGKSNVMDALSFVLGVNARDLRCDHLRDLIHVRPSSGESGDDDGDGKETAVAGRLNIAPVGGTAVMLVYVLDVYEAEALNKRCEEHKAAADDDSDDSDGNGDGFNRVPLGLRHLSAGDELTFERRLTADGTATYRVDGKTKALKAYLAVLEALNVFVQAKNFLVFQGAVTSLAQRSAKDLMRHFEVISGSDASRKDYDTLLAAKADAEKKFILGTNQRKTIYAEYRALKNEKDEAEAYKALEEEVATLRTRRTMLRLYHNRKELAAATAEFEDARAAVADHEEATQAVERQQRDAKQRHGALQRKQAAAEAATKSARKAKTAANAAFTRADNAVTKCKRRQEALTKDKSQCEADVEEHDREVAEVESKLADTRATIAKLTAQTAAPEVEGLSKAQQELFPRLEAEAKQRTAQLITDVEALQREEAHSAARRTEVQAELDSVNAQVDSTAAEREAMQTRHAKFQTVVKEAEADVARRSEELAAKQAQLESDREQQGKVAAELEEVHRALHACKDDSRTSKREQKTVKAVQELVRLFHPHVRGRLVDLVEPTQRKWNTAVMTALGSSANKVVVDTAEQARECISFMRSKRDVPPLTYMLLDKLRPKPVKETVKRAMGGPCRLALHCVKFDAAYDAAVQQAFGGTVICNTLKDAKALRARGVITKCVTEDGSVMAKNHNITGGMPVNGDKGTAFDTRELQRLEAQRNELRAAAEAYEKRLGRYTGASSGRRLSPRTPEIDDLTNNLNTKKSRLAGAVDQVSLAATMLEQLGSQLELLRTKAAALTAALRTLDADASKRAKTMAKLEKQRAAVVASVFKDAKGIDAYRKRVEERDQRLKAVEKQLKDLQQHATALEEHLKFLHGKDPRAALAECEAKIEATKADLTKLHKEAAKKQQALMVASDRASAAEDKLDAVVEAMKQHMKEQHAQRTEVNNMKARGEELTDVLSTKASTVKFLVSERHAVFRDAKRDQIQLASKLGDTLDDDDNDDSAGDGGRDLMASQLPASQPGAGAGAGAGVGVHGDSTGRRLADIEKGWVDKLDFSILPRKDVQRPLETVLLELDDHIARLSDELRSATPNMRALAQFGDAENRLRAQDEVCATLKAASHSAASAFDVVRHTRLYAFRSMFDFVSKHIDGVYKELTRSPSSSVGGSATLVLVNEEDPFAGDGIRYTVMPPGKRFVEMSKLSGGEQTIAALALMFAVHKYAPSPFYIMDEVDAALDNDNVDKVWSYIRARSSARVNPLQCIVISLKNTLYERADTLIGVYKDQRLKSSGTISLDLTQFREGPIAVAPPSAPKSPARRASRPAATPSSTYKPRKSTGGLLGYGYDDDGNDNADVAPAVVDADASPSVADTPSDAEGDGATPPTAASTRRSASRRASAGRSAGAGAGAGANASTPSKRASKASRAKSTPKSTPSKSAAKGVKRSARQPVEELVAANQAAGDTEEDLPSTLPPQRSRGRSSRRQRR